MKPLSRLLGRGRRIVVTATCSLIWTALVARGASATIAPTNQATVTLGNTTTSSVTTNATTSATEWQAIQFLIVPLPPLGPKATADDARRRLSDEIKRLSSAVVQTRTFYQKHPADSHAAEAKKLEATCALQTWQLGGDRYRKSAVAIASAYRRDASQSAADRFDVALSLETIALQPSLGGKRLIDAGDAYERLADSLYNEFGDIPQTYALYNSLVLTCDPTTAQRVAKKVAEKDAPGSVRLGASQAVDLARLVGKPLPGVLTTSQNRPLPLAAPSSKPTVVLFWSRQTRQSDVDAFRNISLANPASVRWIYVGLGVAGADADLGSQAPFPGDFCAEAAGFRSPSVVALNLQQTPCAYVVTPAGRLAGYGRLEDVPALVRTAAQ